MSIVTVRLRGQQAPYEGHFSWSQRAGPPLINSKMPLLTELGGTLGLYLL